MRITENKASNVRLLKIIQYVGVFLLLLGLAGCGGGQSEDDESEETRTDSEFSPSNPTTPAYTLVAANDLGMHCADLDYQVFSILPPFNVVHAQVIKTGTRNTPPRILDNQSINVTYTATEV